MGSNDSSATGTSLEVPQQPGPVCTDYRQLFLNDTPLLDVRAPIEFAKGAFPASVNRPLMTDEERHLIGIRYKQADQQKAIALGAELVTPQLRQQRVAAWAEFAREHPQGALYCFRGGLRSRISQQWLKEAGVELPLVSGGYKALRTFLMETLTELCATLDLVLIGGRTGNGKTLLIQRLGSTVDLEQLANHRGSSFGSMASVQPSNIDFENAVTVALMKLADAGHQRVLLEDEARLIGRVCLPDTLRNAMQAAPILILECDMQQRIENCFDDYVPDLLKRYQATHGTGAGFEAYANHHRGSLSRIQKRFGHVRYQHALDMLEEALKRHERNADTSGYAGFIEFMLREYYDPMYDYQLSRKQHRVVARGYAEELLAWAAQQ
ncbi:tRNA 2-selenouridine(34) synthase MnmH [Granulosicoccus sp. 3-233]|uniref:tRNA 2-selenouridine(34) synthase MnmH n=1 Tax=Granulosicoccus sp. 3-233 TaxID=3417969 RepID=UPI003D34F179